jgi:hypothetical protein
MTSKKKTAFYIGEELYQLLCNDAIGKAVVSASDTFYAGIG